MIIDVKGTKSDGGTKATVSRQNYVLKDNKASKLPWGMAALLFGIAAYLKSALPSAAEPSDEEAPVQPDAEPSRLKLVAQDMDAPPAEAAAAEEPDEGKARAVGSGGFATERSPPAEFMLVDSPPIRFPTPFFQKANISELASFRDALFSANDNTSFGGSGGGGSSAPNPREPVGPGRRPPVRHDEESEGPDDAPAKPPVTLGPVTPREDPDAGEEPRNRAPRTSGPVRLYDVYGCAAVVIALTDLLRNVSDPDGDALSIRNVKVSSGTIVGNGTGWLFDPSQQGPVTITYEVSDGKASIVQQATFWVFDNLPIVGTESADVLVGTACGDTIQGLGGDDNIDGRAGDDRIDGGAGADHVLGGSGHDILVGGEGNDIILGGTGNDQISGGAGDDRLFGEDGDDSIFGDAGDDQIDGGEGSDLLLGGDGQDLIIGGRGADRILGNAGHDTVSGGEGEDIVLGGEGNDSIAGGTGADILMDGVGKDTVDGGAGNDQLVVALDAQSDTYDGGDGIDTLDLAATAEGVEVDLTEGTACGGEIGANAVENIEIVRAGSGDDALVGSSGAETLLGGAGEDILLGLDGNDSLSGGEGQDTIAGGDGNDQVDGGAGDDLLSDGAGADMVLGGAGDDHVVASSDGVADVYDGGEGKDTLDYSLTEQGIVVDVATGKATGVEIGNDAIGQFEELVGGAGDDRFVAGTQSLVITGGEGDDVFEFVRPLDANTTVTVFHTITDFEAGDLIKMSKYDIFDEIADGIEDQFEAVYGDKVDIDDGRLRYRYETSDLDQRTIIEVDLNRDRIYETTIYLDGHHAIIVVENSFETS